MAVIARRLLTNFSKGELSPKMEGRPDLVAYFEGCRRLENWFILRQGGLERRWGLRFITELGRVVNGQLDSPAIDSIIFPFEATVNDAFIVVMFQAGAMGGSPFVYFYKNKARVDQVPGTPVALGGAYGPSQYGAIHFTQSVDVMYFFNPDQRQRKLSRFSDVNWTLDEIFYDPPPTFEQDIPLSLYTGAGQNISFSSSAGSVTVTSTATVFLASDVDRLLVLKSPTLANSRLKITAVASGTSATATVLDGAVSAGVNYSTANVFYRLSPQTTLDPDKKAPVNTTVTLTAGAAGFRTQDVGKYIKIYAGIVQITGFTSNTVVTGRLLAEMTGAATADPPAAVAGAWSLETSSWADILPGGNGYPRTGEFFGGRLAQASTPAQPTTWWLSAPDDFENYAAGVEADKAVEFTIASRQLNRIEWLADNKDLFIGTSGTEHRAEGGKEGEPIGGDVLPRVRRTTAEGSAGVQPVVIGRKILFIDRSRSKLFAATYDVEQDEFDSVEITGAADHIFGSGVRLRPIAVQRRREPRLFFVTDDGVLVVLTYSVKEKVIGFTRILTDGLFRSVAVIPTPITSTGLRNDQVWVVVQRTINGADRLYLEVFEDYHENLTSRAWSSMQTDSGLVFTGVTGTTVSGLGHLEAKMVDVVVNGVFIGQKLVASGQITLIEPVTNATVEVGLRYRSIAETFRPAIEGQIIEGAPRSWSTLWARVRNTIGGKINGRDFLYAPMGSAQIPFTGDKKTYQGGVSLDGSITIEQDAPYPMEVLAMFGRLNVGDEG